MAIEWRPAMSVDGGKIDDDHRYLIELINEFERSIAEGFDLESVHKILSNLKFYTVYHFAREEAAQKAAKYPDWQEHAAEHRNMIKYVDAIIETLNGYNECNKAEEIKGNIAAMLRSWLIDHIIQFDMTMKPYVAKMRQFNQDFSPITAISSRRAGR